MSGNQVYGFGTIATGLATVTGNTVVTARPAVATAALVVAAYAAPVEFGRAGAVATSGAVLTVGGTSGRFATIAAALAAAADGDTIRVAAGFYAESGLVVSRKVVIEGVGGLARIAAPAGTGPAILSSTDLTLRNLEISGASLLAGAAAAVSSTGGALTLVNSFLHDNGAGVVAAAGTVGIYDTELARNGTADGAGANVDAGAMGTLVVRNSFLHDAPGGAELRSRAGNTVIDGSRIVQSAGSGAFAIDLPESGRATITASAVEKKAGSIGGALVHAGGGTTRDGSTVAVSGSTLISDVVSGPTRFVVAEAGAGPLAVSGVAFGGGAAGSVQVAGGGNAGATTVSGMVVNAAAPWGTPGAAAAPALLAAAPVAQAAQRGVLQLRVSEDAWRGHAQFTVAVDGKAVGGTLTATASHAAGQSQNFTIAGDFAPGAHTVAVSFVNDLGSPADGGDRNLFVDAVGFNGQDLHAAAALLQNGTSLFTTGAVSRPTNVSVNLSEDAWKGDAMALITVDGKMVGDLVTVTASHAAGRTQAMSFLLDLTPGGHTVGVAFLNDAKGGPGEDRNLFVDSVDINGTHYAAAAAALPTTGTTNFAFTVEPPAAANANLFLTAGLPQAWAGMIPFA